MPLFRRTRDSRTFTDYRQAAKAVIERRRARKLGGSSDGASGKSPNPRETYAPQDRLHAVSLQVDGLVSDALHIPRRWEAEAYAPMLRSLIRLNLIVTASAVIMLSGFIGVFFWGHISGFRIVIGLIAYSGIMVGACVAIVRFSKEIRISYPFCYWIAWGVAALNLLAAFAAFWLVLAYPWVFAHALPQTSTP
jgi:hypothetical protein